MIWPVITLKFLLMSKFVSFFDEIFFNNIFKLSLILLAVFLPFHGLISVLFEPFRYWKEVVVLFLFLTYKYHEILNFKNLIISRNNKNFIKFDKAEIFGILFILWGIILVLTNPDFKTSLLAFRYLGFGVLVYLIFSRLLKFFPETFNIIFFKKHFSQPFVVAAVLSVLFGIWGKFGGGFEVLETIYSGTISSWVPGQKIPIFHEVFGIARMQGGSSGPMEFGIIILIAFFILMCLLIENLKTEISRNFEFFKILLNILIGLILLFGIYQSYSRAVLGGCVVLIIYFLWTQAFVKFWQKFSDIFFNKSKVVKFTQILFLSIVVIASFKLIITKTDVLEIFEHKIIERVGTTDHLTRPVEAISIGINNFWIGDLGGLGPAARQQNLTKNNDDSALIAENVLIDVFAQTGIIGILFYSLFLIFGFLKILKSASILFLVIFLIANTATVFDMTPVSILVFFLLAVFVKNKKE